MLYVFSMEYIVQQILFHVYDVNNVDLHPEIFE